MIADVQRLIDSYADWLKDKSQLREVDEWVEITTPYLDRHNDCLQIYAKPQGDGYLLSDDGYVISDLEQSGCKLDSPKRQELLLMTLNGFGVKQNAGAIEVHASRSNFPLRKHNLVQAMLAVNDMFCMAVPTVASLFIEDVQAWRDEKEVRYTPNVKFTGKSGYDHVFDFVIPKFKSHPERIIKAINRPSSDSAKSLVFSWMDTKDVRQPEAKAFALLNDTEHRVPDTVTEALANYSVTPILWGQRDLVLEELAA